MSSLSSPRLSESGTARILRFPSEPVPDGVSEDRLLILLPCLNEGPRLGALLEELATRHPEADLLVVDDGSDDDTEAVARRQGAIVLRLPHNLGYGAALQAGYKYAWEKGYFRVVQMDGDGQHPPAEVATLLREAALQDADVIIGSRFLGRPCYPIPPLRRLGISLFSGLTTLLVGRRVTDPTSGFQVLNRRVLRFYGQDFYPYDYPDSDMLVRLHRGGYRFLEVGVEMREGAAGKSMHQGLAPLWYGYKLLLSTVLSWLTRGESGPR